MSGVFLGNVRGQAIISVAINPASVAANTSAEQTFTVPGLLIGDFVELSKPTVTAGLSIATSRVSAADTLAITFVNNTASPIDAALETYVLMISRPDSPGQTNFSI